MLNRCVPSPQHSPPPFPQRRPLSRHTPARRCRVESRGDRLPAAGGRQSEAALSPALETVRPSLSQRPAALTRQEILARWPESEPPPRADSLWRSLAGGCEPGILVRTGAGTKAEAFRYGP